MALFGLCGAIGIFSAVFHIFVQNSAVLHDSVLQQQQHQLGISSSLQERKSSGRRSPLHTINPHVAAATAAATDAAAHS